MHLAIPSDRLIEASPLVPCLCGVGHTARDWGSFLFPYFSHLGALRLTVWVGFVGLSAVACSTPWGAGSLSVLIHLKLIALATFPRLAL